MVGEYRGRPGGKYKEKKLIGKGVLEAVRTDGPHNEWLGMPPYYIHHLTVDAVEYSYLSGDEKLSIPIGKTVTFRYKETKSGNMVDKKSLGVSIDPNELR